MLKYSVMHQLNNINNFLLMTQRYEKGLPQIDRIQLECYRKLTTNQVIQRKETNSFLFLRPLGALASMNHSNVPKNRPFDLS